MTNTFPTFVNAGAISKPTATSVTPALPTGMLAGNLLFSVFAEPGAAGNTYTVSAPWQIINTPQDTGGFSLLVAYTYVGANNTVTAPTWSTAGAATAIHAVCYQFSNARMAAPIGNTTQNGGTGGQAAINASAILATADHSLAVAFAITTLSSPTWPPSGWTDLGTTFQFVGAYKTLTNVGDSSGAIAQVETSMSGYDIVVVELEGALPFVGTDWFNGVSVTRR